MIGTDNAGLDPGRRQVGEDRVDLSRHEVSVRLDTGTITGIGPGDGQGTGDFEHGQQHGISMGTSPREPIQSG
jgi:hypothetical protein